MYLIYHRHISTAAAERFDLGYTSYFIRWDTGEKAAGVNSCSCFLKRVRLLEEPAAAARTPLAPDQEVNTYVKLLLYATRGSQWTTGIVSAFFFVESTVCSSVLRVSTTSHGHGRLGVGSRLLPPEKFARGTYTSTSASTYQVRKIQQWLQLKKSNSYRAFRCMYGQWESRARRSIEQEKTRTRRGTGLGPRTRSSSSSWLYE